MRGGEAVKRDNQPTTAQRGTRELTMPKGKDDAAPAHDEVLEQTPNDRGRGRRGHSMTDDDNDR